MEDNNEPYFPGVEGLLGQMNNIPIDISSGNNELTMDHLTSFAESLSRQMHEDRQFIVSTGEAGAQAFHDAVEENIKEVVPTEYSKEHLEKLRIMINELANGE